MSSQNNAYRIRSMPRTVLALVAGILAAACSGPGADGGDARIAEGTSAPTVCDPAAAGQVVMELGTRMKSVPLLAADSVREEALDEAYASLVTPELLEHWREAPSAAPGREASSPWPRGIEVDSIEAAEDGSCRVRGTVTYVTSVEEATGGVAALRPISLRLVHPDDWRVAGLVLGPYASTPAAEPPSPDAEDSSGSSRAAAAVIRRYYEAIGAEDYRSAYLLWDEQGRSSGQSLQEFAAGFAATDQVSVQVGSPGRIEGAAGSRFVEIPVEVRARLANGEAQRFSGRYTLRRAVVDGATSAQREWHIYAADLEQAR